MTTDNVKTKVKGKTKSLIIGLIVGYIVMNLSTRTNNPKILWPIVIVLGVILLFSLTKSLGKNNPFLKAINGPLDIIIGWAKHPFFVIIAIAVGILVFGSIFKGVNLLKDSPAGTFSNLDKDYNDAKTSKEKQEICKKVNLYISKNSKEIKEDLPNYKEELIVRKCK